MDTKNGNSINSLRIMFWIFTVIVFPALFFIGSNVIGNERASIERDEKLSKCLHEYIIPMKEDIAQIKVAVELLR